MAGVMARKIGRLRKDGLKPEAFFHPNSISKAKDECEKIAGTAIQAIKSVYD